MIFPMPVALEDAFPKESFPMPKASLWGRDSSKGVPGTFGADWHGTGKTAKAVKQDFLAKVFLMSLMAAYAHPIEEKVRAEYKADQNRKHDQKINRTHALAMTRDILVGLFARGDHAGALNAFDQIVSKTKEIIRPNRKNPRKHRLKIPYYMNHRPL